MASTKSVSRAKGQSAVSAAAYRAGDKLFDENSKTYDYQKRSGVLSEPPRLYRMQFYLSQAARPDSIFKIREVIPNYV
ncbi:hypothetical protein ACS8E2_07330 [Psychrobacter glaciei]|uniref:hypothetical protein n=1 Tax=Psychrobacter glaciei TaxID=619771 RepID=UPI003F468925